MQKLMVFVFTSPASGSVRWWVDSRNPRYRWIQTEGNRFAIFEVTDHEVIVKIYNQAGVGDIDIPTLSAIQGIEIG
jgi:hypothetical protein